MIILKIILGAALTTLLVGILYLTGLISDNKKDDGFVVTMLKGFFILTMFLFSILAFYAIGNTFLLYTK